MIKWFPLDNAGIFYPSIVSDRVTTVFRVSATLDHPIKVKELQEALDKTMEDYPQFNVQCRRGFFWFYFEENKKRLLLTQDSLYPCRKIPIRRRGIHPIQVKVFHNRVAVEVSHASTDGTGAFIFLQHLIHQYFIRLGYTISHQEITEELKKEQLEDSFKKYFKPQIPPPRKSDKAFHVPWKAESKEVYNIITGYLPADRVKEVAKSFGVTITEYLLTVLGYSLQEILLSFPPKKRRKHSKPFRLMVPINLRKIFPSKTLRNFFLSIEPSFDPELGEFTFQEILKIIHHFMQVEVNDKYISRQISRNIRGQMESKLIPLFIKNIILRSLYIKMGESKYSTSISNMGIVEFDESIKERIKNIEFIPPPSALCKIKAGVATYNNKMSICFGSIVKETQLEQLFFSHLIKDGIPVEIESNRS
ncbi:hypothetical protein EW093_09975 [Thiospirochaeta perfilievii]|uniref:Alcohol acetyltransferase n=1 Tax=Thiospirochaeta perfilievii TaxID=252967 RepID=A0A5C1QA57_9SPIO|nr:hypothetical protein [Thiospirochaeta perfilievii]QEN05023.1 hypothetical protein EW093_09975 [Thiospirochaeta perfilievii]